MRGLRRLDGSWWIELALHGLLLALAVPTLGCGCSFLSQEVSRSPAVAAADGFGPAPSTVTVWVEAVEPGFVRVVGKAFDDPDSAAAGAAPVQPRSPPIRMIDFGGESDPTEAVSALDVMRIDGGFFVAWQLRGSLIEGGETFGLFTDLALAPVGDPFVIFGSSRPPAAAQGRNELWVYYVYYCHRVVVMTDDLRISYALIDSDTHALRMGSSPRSKNWSMPLGIERTLDSEGPVLDTPERLVEKRRRVRRLRSPLCDRRRMGAWHAPCIPFVSSRQGRRTGPEWYGIDEVLDAVVSGRPRARSSAAGHVRPDSKQYRPRPSSGSVLFHRWSPHAR